MWISCTILQIFIDINLTLLCVLQNAWNFKCSPERKPQKNYLFCTKFENNYMLYTHVLLYKMYLLYENQENKTKYYPVCMCFVVCCNNHDIDFNICYVCTAFVKHWIWFVFFEWCFMPQSRLFSNMLRKSVQEL